MWRKRENTLEVSMAGRTYQAYYYHQWMGQNGKGYSSMYLSILQSINNSLLWSANRPKLKLFSKPLIDIWVVSFLSFHPSCRRKATAHVGDWRVASFGHTWASSPETIWHNGTSVRMIFSQSLSDWLTLVITFVFSNTKSGWHIYSSVAAPFLSL